jgi:GMP synthase-like glutamine amidotransferase
MAKRKIGLLVTGHTPEGLSGKHGNYAEMFMALLGDFDFTFQPYFVVDGVFPGSPKDADAWLISGSKFGVYEEHDWIRKLEAFIRSCYEQKVPMVGICFGHQAMAKALGGKVEKFEGGWAAGATSYQRSDTGQMQTLLAWHQDQVIEVPEGGKVIGSNDFCGNAVVSYGGWGLSYQPHPEFRPAFFEDLAELRGSVLPSEIYQSAKTVKAPLETGAVAKEIASFLQRASGDPEADAHREGVMRAEVEPTS